MGKQSTMVLNQNGNSHTWNDFSSDNNLYQYQFMSVQFSGKEHRETSSSTQESADSNEELIPPPVSIPLSSSTVLAESSAESADLIEEEEKHEWIECEEEYDYPEFEEEEEFYYDSEDEEYYEEYESKYEFGGRIRQTSHYKKEKISSTHKHINSNVQSRQSKKSAVIASYLEAEKDNKSAKTNGSRWNNPFAPGSCRVYVPPVSRSRKPGKIQTQFESDADLARAIQLSKQEITRHNQRISQQQASFLADLQNRELTPEDYELLLLLDEGVKKKTISRSDVEKLPCRLFDESSSCGGHDHTCVVCMGEYEDGEKITKLPCGHEFHTQCIGTWLTMSSVNCPTDNLPVEL